MERPLVPNQDNTEEITINVRSRVDGNRLDQYLARRFTDYTRTFLKKLIQDGYVTLNGKTTKASNKIRTGDQIHVTLPKLEPLHLQPESFPLDIIYEDDSFAVINKPPDLVIHPSKGHLGGTLVNALLAHFAELSQVNDVYRPGIVHRLDRFTSGLILIAKTNQAHAGLAKQFEERTIQKEYLALVEGVVKVDTGSMHLPLAMDPRNRECMTVSHGGKPAETHYKVIARYPKWTLVHVFPKTGRTHQIRVHLKSLGHPIVADSAYGAKPALTRELLCEQTDNADVDDLPEVLLDRQALHAWKLIFAHPKSGKATEIIAPPAADLQKVFGVLQRLWPRRELVEYGLVRK